MIPEILMVHNSICEIESEFNVTFNRNSAVVQQHNGTKVIHLLCNSYVLPTIATDKTVCSAISIISPQNEVATLIAVLENSGSSFNGFEILDKDSNVLESSSNLFPNPIRFEPIPGSGSSEGFFDPKPTIHDVVTEYNPTTKELRVQATLDVKYMGLLELDILHIDVTVTLL